MEKEIDNTINFLEITILKETQNLSLNTYRKHTTTDTFIPNDFCHTQDHKYAAIRYLTNRMNTHNLSAVKKKSNASKHILCHNKYDISILNRFFKSENKRKRNKTKWTKFTYVGKETKFITKLFNDSSVKIAFTTQNTTGKLLSSKQNPNQNQFEKIGVYQLTCPDCNMKYV
jgi:hypothetical protein